MNIKNITFCLYIITCTVTLLFQLCQPKGLAFRTHKDVKKPRFHIFLITKEDRSRTYGSALTFYEEVKDKKICSAMQTLQHMFLADSTSSLELSDTSSSLDSCKSPKSPIRTYDANKDKLYVTKTICLISPLLLVRSSKSYLRQLFEAISKPSDDHLPLESYVHNILYEVPLPPPGRSMKFYGVDTPIFCQRPSK